MTDAYGKVTGLLDIAKCLYDAMTRLRKAAAKKEAEEGGGGGDGEDGSTAAVLAVMEAAKATKGKASAKQQRALQARYLLLVKQQYDSGLADTTVACGYGLWRFKHRWQQRAVPIIETLFADLDKVESRVERLCEQHSVMLTFYISLAL